MIGFANYHRDGNVVTTNVHLQGALPNTTYSLTMMWGDVCSFFGFYGDTITTNSNGVGNETASITVPAASTRFFVSVIGGTFFFNDTPAVTLTP